MLLYVGVFTTVVYRVFTQQVGAGVKPGYEIVAMVAACILPGVLVTITTTVT